MWRGRWSTWHHRQSVKRGGRGWVGGRRPLSVQASQENHHRVAEWSTPQKEMLVNPTEEHASLRAMMRKFVKEEVEPQAAEHDRAERLNRELFRRLGSELGVLGPTVSTEHGGAALDATACCAIGEELSTSDPGLALSWLAHAILLVNNLNENGSEAQKADALPGLVSGEKIGGMCMSEAGAGTDVLGMRTSATRLHDGSFRVSGSKYWITNGTPDGTSTGDCFLVYARTGEGENAASPRPAVSLFLVHKGAPGFRLGQRIANKCGMRSSPTAELVFDDCVLPPSALVGEWNGGAVAMMRNLELERLVLAAMACGIARRCLDVMLAYALERTAFGQPLTKFGQIQAHVADSYAELEAARAFVYAVANSSGTSGLNQRLDTDAVKLVAARTATTIADRAVQVLGGAGYVDSVVERLWRDSKLLQIGGGTNESHQKNITADLARLYDPDRP